MATEGEALIRLQGIKKVFYTDEVETHALSEVHMEIKQGEYVAISGPSGCGKTTLLSILGLLDTASHGEYFLDGRPVAQLAPADRALLAYAGKLTRAPASVSTDDIQALRDTGIAEADILLANLIVAYFNFVNRIALGLGVAFNPAEVSGYDV